MPKIVTLYRVVISCPSDAAAELAIAKETVSRWNAENAATEQLAFEPVSWETHVAPYIDKGRRVQDRINDTIINNADLLVAIFRARLGTPTGEHLSGTVEEITQFMEAGKEAWVFFRTGRPEPPPEEEGEQYRALMKFKEGIRPNSLYKDFGTDGELRDGLYRALEIHASELKKNSVPAALLKYAEETGRSSIPTHLQVEFELDDKNLFKVVECIGDSLKEGSRVVASDYLNLRDEKWRTYWCRKGLGLLEINFKASLRGVRILRVFIISERHLRQ
jgi:hypothetical protein